MQVLLSGWIALLLGALAPAQQPATPSPAAPRTAPPTARPLARDERLERWELDLLLDRPADVVREGRLLVEPGGELAGSGRALALVARAVSSTSGPEPARALLERAAVEAAERPLVELALARLDIAEDRLEDVERRLAAPPEASDPVRHAERAEAWLLLGRARFRAGRLDVAEPLLAGFCERAPLDAEAPAAWNMRAQIALRHRDADRARAFRDRARSLSTWHGYLVARLVQVRESPEAALPRLGLAELWASAGDLPRAEVAVRQALARDPELARAWALSGELARKRGDAAAALADYTRALELDAALHEVRWNRALLSEAAGRLAPAREDYEALVAAGAADTPPLLEARLRLARLQLAAGELGAARTQHARYAELGGEEPLAGPEDR